MKVAKEDGELIPVAMNIILNAGDARIKIAEALAQCKLLDFVGAKTFIQEAKECIHLAHVAQTEVIQAEAGGQSYAYSLLFTHAQDTLMTIMSEERSACEMIELFHVMYQELKKR